MNREFLQRISFWIIVVIALTLVLGFKQGDYIFTFYFICFLLPIMVGGSYVFNEYLVPIFFETGRYGRFTLYTLYLIVVTLWLEMIVTVVAFIFLANYQYSNMNPQATNLTVIGLTMFFTVLLEGFLKTIKKVREQQNLLKELQSREPDFITVKSERKNRRIELTDLVLVESLADYVKLHSGEEIVITKETISNISRRLPSEFIRVHRSFIVNKNFIRSFTSESIEIESQTIPISRTYKKIVRENLEN